MPSGCRFPDGSQQEQHTQRVVPDGAWLRPGLCRVPDQYLGERSPLYDSMDKLPPDWPPRHRPRSAVGTLHIGIGWPWVPHTVGAGNRLRLVTVAAATSLGKQIGRALLQDKKPPVRMNRTGGQDSV